jgi:hypothetical protein
VENDDERAVCGTGDEMRSGGRVMAVSEWRMRMAETSGDGGNNGDGGQ